jgi:hypothetical protein
VLEALGEPGAHVGVLREDLHGQHDRSSSL